MTKNSEIVLRQNHSLKGEEEILFCHNTHTRDSIVVE